jgi:hypothetical protein
LHHGVEEDPEAEINLENGHDLTDFPDRQRHPAQPGRGCGHNRAVVGQEGYGNSAHTLQLGRRNIIGVAQFGSGHTAVTTQDGNGNAIGVIQAGHNNDAHVTQVGHGNVSVIVQDSPTYRREERARAQPLALTQ